MVEENAINWLCSCQLYPHPHYLYNSRAVVGTFPGIYRKLCPPQTRDLAQDVPWTSQSTELNPRTRYTSDQGARGCAAETYPGIY